MSREYAAPVSLRHAILGLLARRPSTGYDLTRVFDASLRTSWHAGHSQIYPELARLTGDGFAEVVQRGARGSKTYALTEAGREELRRWLVEDEPDRSQRNESGLRLFLVQLLPPAERRAALERDLEHVEATLASYADLRASVGADEPFAAQLDLGLRIDGAVREWLVEQIEATYDA
jgi:PadR family transcriptional regulator AphA